MIVKINKSNHLQLTRNDSNTFLTAAYSNNYYFICRLVVTVIVIKRCYYCHFYCNIPVIVSVQIHRFRVVHSPVAAAIKSMPDVRIPDLLTVNRQSVMVNAVIRFTNQLWKYTVGKLVIYVVRILANTLMVKIRICAKTLIKNIASTTK